MKFRIETIKKKFNSSIYWQWFNWNWDKGFVVVVVVVLCFYTIHRLEEFNCGIFFCVYVLSVFVLFIVVGLLSFNLTSENKLFIFYDLFFFFVILIPLLCSNNINGQRCIVRSYWINRRHRIGYRLRTPSPLIFPIHSSIHPSIYSSSPSSS